MFTAPTQSALAEKPHSTHTNFVCVLRFSAEVCWHRGHSRLVFWGGTGTRRPPFHCVLYSSWRRSSNGLASRIERLSLDFWRTSFPGCALVPLVDRDIFFTCRSSTNTTAWFLLMSFEDLCTKSFLILAILACSLVILALAFFQFLENLLLPASRRCS
jgi:hypothetical protein